MRRVSSAVMITTIIATVVIATIAVTIQLPPPANADKGGTSNQNAEPLRSCNSPNKFKDNNGNGIAGCQGTPGPRP